MLSLDGAAGIIYFLLRFFCPTTLYRSAGIRTHALSVDLHQTGTVRTLHQLICGAAASLQFLQTVKKADIMEPIGRKEFSLASIKFHSIQYYSMANKHISLTVYTNVLISLRLNYKGERSFLLQVSNNKEL